mgnify:FL=1
MKKKYMWLVASVMSLSFSFGSCVDEIAFGNSFLDKAPGGDVTSDTVFNSAEYTRQYLNALYRSQYYGLPWFNGEGSSFPYPMNYWSANCVSYLTDMYQIFWTGCGTVKSYYSGSRTAGDGSDRCAFDFIKNNVWGTTRAGWNLIEHIGSVPGIEEAEKKEMGAQAKCLIAAAYYNIFRHYGGLPIIRKTFTGTETSYDIPRATVEETVNFIVGLLDEAKGDLPWAFSSSNTVSGNYDNAENDMGRWTRAGAMALKCKVLLFAASPLFNDDVAYAGGASEAEMQRLVWYGSYRKELWDQCYTACQEFFNELRSKGFYNLEKPASANPTPGEYRYTFRHAYYYRDSKEILHSTRITNTNFKSNYFSSGLSNAGRIGSPTWEFMCKFPWADGRPFDWNEAEREGKLNEIFVEWADPNAKYDAKNAVLTRDPRMYESIQVNGVPRSLSANGQMSGDPWEGWINGAEAGTSPLKQTTSMWGSGFMNNKHMIDARKSVEKDNATKGIPIHWPYLRLSDLYLTYAEAMLQSKNDFDGAIEMVNEVRARVGLGDAVKCNPGQNLRTDKQALLNLILNERACELAFEDSRYFDLIRYKMKDVFEKPLHGLIIYRLGDDGKRDNDKWQGTDKEANIPFPSKFEYEITPITTNKRVWWTNGFDSKWYLSPIKQTEIEKGYLIQNPGW